MDTLKKSMTNPIGNKVLAIQGYDLINQYKEETKKWGN